MKLWVDSKIPAPNTTEYVQMNSLDMATFSIALNEQTGNRYKSIDIGHIDDGWGGEGAVELLKWLKETGRNYLVVVHDENLVEQLKPYMVQETKNTSLLKVYIAGPDVFRDDAVELGVKYKDFLTKNGFEGLYPLDNVCSTSKEIADGNFRLIDECDIVLANMNPFRGIEPDSGTSCEIGYAIAMGKQVYCYMDDTRSMTEKFGSMDENGMEIENFGHPLNLMIAEKATIFKGDFYNAVLLLAERLQEKTVDNIISRATAISEQSRGLADDLSKFKDGFDKD